MSQSLIITTGIAGSTKSTWAAEIASRHDYDIVNMDAIRGELTGDMCDQSRNDEVYKIATGKIYDSLESGRSVVFDATNRNVRARRHLIEIGKAHGARVVGVYFKTDVNHCLARINKRERKVPDHIVQQQFDNLVPPTIGEGFDELQTMHVDNPDYVPTLI